MFLLQTKVKIESSSQSRPILHQFLRILRLLAISYCLVCLLMMVFETQLVYPIPTPLPLGQLFFGKNSEGVQFQSQDGTMLQGRFYPHSDARAVILYCHGNAEDISSNDSYIAFLHNKLSASILIFDYRGYGQSNGSPNESGLIEDGLAAQRWLAERTDQITQNIVLFGRSLGGGVAVAIAEQQGAQALILHSTFPNMPDVAATHYPWLPVRWMMRNRYPSTERVRHFPGPLLQFHGTEDKIIPLAMGRQLFDASPSQQKRFIEISGGNHNGPLPEYCYEALVEFLDALAAERSL